MNCVIISISIGALFCLSFCFALEASKARRFAYDDKGLRDPFYPVVSPEGYLLVNLEPATEMSDIKLEGIIYDPQGVSFAIVNGTVVREFEMIGGFKLKTIEKNEITLEKNDQIYKIQLKKEE
ncbi:MAG: hypothetical protein V1674_07065 [Candidatus Omnitrophota bacterium]